MVDQAWLKSVVEAARELLWNGAAEATDAAGLIAGAGLRAPRTEAERLLLIGIVADVRVKATQRGVAGHHSEAVIAYLRTHSRTCGLTRAQVAEVVGVSDSWLAHTFSRDVGVSFSRFLCDLRIADAVDLLDSGSMSVKEVAAAAGFRSTGGFIRCFSSRFGMAPGAWRERRKTQDANGW